MTPIRRTILATFALLASAVVLVPTAGDAASSVPSTVSLECSLTEPFLSIEISGAGIWMSNSGEPWERLRVVSTSPSPGLRRWKLRQADGSSATFTLRPGPGSDGMSDAEYTYELEAAFGSPTLIGGCNKVPNGSRPAVVVGVVDGDTLNVRAAASPTSARRVTVLPAGLLWVTSTTRSNGWAPVAVVVRGESGPASVVRGWANAKYVKLLA